MSTFATFATFATVRLLYPPPVIIFHDTDVSILVSATMFGTTERSALASASALAFFRNKRKKGGGAVIRLEVIGRPPDARPRPRRTTG